MLVNSIRRSAQRPAIAIVNTAASRAGSSIPVILLEDVENKGVAGECVKVKRGFARNYLLPKRKAVYLTETNRLKHADLMEAAKAGSDASAVSAAVAAALEEKVQVLESLKSLDTPLKITMRTVSGTSGLYGSVTPSMISEALSEHGISVKASNIDSNKIDQTGLFKVSILGKELEVEVVDESA